jgi:hypothetical protein
MGGRLLTLKAERSCREPSPRWSLRLANGLQGGGVTFLFLLLLFLLFLLIYIGFIHFPFDHQISGGSFRFCLKQSGL